MATGGLAYCPLRLGGTPESGWSPEAHARAALTLASANQVTPIAVFDVTLSGATYASAHSLLSRGGQSTVSGEWRATYSAQAQTFYIQCPSGFTPPGGAKKRGFTPTCALISRHGKTGIVTALPSGSVHGLQSTNGPFFSTPTTAATYTIVVYGVVEEVDARDYGADENKRASETEGDEPYAAAELRGLQGSLGSFGSRKPASLVTIENIAIARQLALISRMAERHACNQLPATSGQAIWRWAKILDVPVGDGKEWKIRKRCNRKWMFLGQPANAANVEAELLSIFGDAYVGINRFEGTLDAPPVPTYWPVSGDPGPAALDIGNGTWTSDRSRVQVQLSSTTGTSDDVIVYLAKTDLADFFGWALPAWCTWDWTLTDTGFILGTSILGRESL